MKALFGDKELVLDFKKIKTTLIQNMLRVHLASVEKRLESCKRCPLITQNPSGFSAQRSIDPEIEQRLQNYPGLKRGYPVPYYPPLAERVRNISRPTPPIPDNELVAEVERSKAAYQELRREIKENEHRQREVDAVANRWYDHHRAGHHRQGERANRLQAEIDRRKRAEEQARRQGNIAATATGREANLRTQIPQLKKDYDTELARIGSEAGQKLAAQAEAHRTAIATGRSARQASSERHIQDASALQDELDTEKETVVAVAGKLDKSKQEKESLLNKLNAAKGSVKSLDETISNSKKRIEELESKIQQDEGTREEKDRLVAKVASLNEEIEEYVQAKDESEDRATKLEAQLEKEAQKYQDYQTASDVNAKRLQEQINKQNRELAQLRPANRDGGGQVGLENTAQLAPRTPPGPRHPLGTVLLTTPPGRLHQLGSVTPNLSGQPNPNIGQAQPPDPAGPSGPLPLGQN